MNGEAESYRGAHVGMVLFVLLVASVSACAAPSYRGTLPPPTPEAPQWDERSFREHLRVLNDESTTGRTLGTPGFGRLASYVRDRMREYMLQPGLQDGYLVPFSQRYNVTGRSRLVLERPDSLEFAPGVDFLADGRSDSVDLVTDVLTVLPPDSALGDVEGEVVVLVRPAATEERLQTLAARGARAVLIVGRLAPVPSLPARRGLGVIQVTPETLVRITDIPSAETYRVLHADVSRTYRLEHPVRIRVNVQAVSMETFHAIGIVAGRHPVLANDVILVCTDLRASLPIEDVRVTDVTEVGQSTAALLETARRTAAFGRYHQVPERSVLFATWMNVDVGRSPLARYVQAPLWDLNRTRAVIYIGLAEERVAEVEALLAPYGVQLYRVPPPEAAVASPSILLEPEGPARRLARQHDRPLRTVDDIEQELLVSRGGAQALEMARQTLDLVLRTATTTAPVPPVEEDTLAAPALID